MVRPRRIKAALRGRGTLAGKLKGRTARPVPPETMNAILLAVAG